MVMFWDNTFQTNSIYTANVQSLFPSLHTFTAHDQFFMNHWSSRSILVSELLFIVCLTLVWDQTILWVLASMHYYEFQVLWYLCGLCI